MSDTYLEDGLGSVSAVLREGGSVAASYAYDPWGGESQAMESVPGIGSRFELPHYGYNAEEASPATGSQYLRARWYDPSMGAFGSQDTYLGDSTDPSTLNRYAYAEGNPVAFSDPTGHVTAARNRQKKQQAATQRARQASKSRSAATKTSHTVSSVVRKAAGSIARVGSGLVKSAPLAKMSPELSKATNTVFGRVPKTVNSVVVVGSGAVTRSAVAGGRGGSGGGGSGGGWGSGAAGTARAACMTASAIRARNYTKAAKAAFCGTAERMGGDSSGSAVDWAAIGHGALDLLGFVPGLGAAADVANGLWYAAEGNYVDAAMSFVSAVPGVGDAAAAAKMGAKAGLAAIETADAALAASRAAKKLSASEMTKALKSAKSKVKREIERFDPAKESQGPAAKDHVHFTNGTSMNNDGTIHDKKKGTPFPSKATSEFLEQGGWAGEVKE